MIKDAIINEAITWLGTPWQHHQKVKGLGADCVGFLCGVAYAVGVDVSPIECNYTRQTEIDVDSFDLVGFEVNISDIEAGDLLFFRVGFQCPVRHCGIMLSQGKFIHSSQKIGRVAIESLTHPHDRLLARSYRVYSPISP